MARDERIRTAVEAFRKAGKRGLTRVALAKALGQASVRTADRVCADLEKQGAVFHTRTEGTSQVVHYTMDPGPAWDPGFGQQTQLALRLANLTLGKSGKTGFQKQLEILEKYTTKKLSAEDQRIFECLRSCTRLNGGVIEKQDREQEEALQVVLEAFSSVDARKVELEYARPGEAARRFVFRPYRVIHDLFSGGTYLLGEEEGKPRPSILRFSRMKSVRLLNLPAVYRYKDQLQLAEEYEFNGWASPEPPFTVRLRVKGTPHIHALKEAPPDFKGFMVVEERGDVAVFEFKANCETSITPWVLKLGKVAEVLAPPELRETIRTEVEAMVEAYCAHY